MIKQENNIEFLNKLSNMLAKRVSPVSTVLAVNKLFKSYMNIDKTEFVIWDNNSMLLKDFSNEWKSYGSEVKEIKPKAE